MVSPADATPAAPRRGPGLRSLSALLFVAVLLGGAAFIHFVHEPVLRGRIQGGTDALVAEALDEAARARDEDLARTEEVFRAGSEHLVDRWRRDLEDLPFELVAGDPAATRGLVVAETLRAGDASRDNARLLAEELSRRNRARTERLATRLRDHQERAGRALAAEAALSSSFVALGILASLLALHGFLLGRGVLAPVARIAEGADRLASGDLSHRVRRGGARELDDLAGGLNRMAAALQATQAELREAHARLVAANESLEQRVREKSMALVRAETLATIGTLAGGVAHEFNNLLGGILGTAEDALEDAGGALRESLDLIVRTARRGCAVTENLLRFARPPDPRVEAVDAASVARDAAALLAPEAGRRGVVVEVLADDVPPLRADPSELHQVVLNLLANAVTFTPAGGRVEVSLRREGEDGILSVRDTGPGIAPEHLPRLFEPFFTTRGAEGTGLGLAVSHRIARAHGGDITAANAPGGGALFEVRLPLRGPAPEGAP